MSYFTRSLGRAVLGANALAPRGNSRLLTAPSFFASWFTTELGAPLLLADALDTANFVRKGGLGSAKGRVAVGLRAAAAGVSLFQWRQATKAGLAFEQGFGDYADLDGLDGMPDFVPADPKGDLLPFFSGSEKRRRQKDVVFAEVDGVKLRLDVYEPQEPPPEGVTRPCVIYVHGGAWVIGDKREQGRREAIHEDRGG